MFRVKVHGSNGLYCLFLVQKVNYLFKYDKKLSDNFYIKVMKNRWYPPILSNLIIVSGEQVGKIGEKSGRRLKKN